MRLLGTPIEKLRAHMSRFAAEFEVDIVVPEHLSNTRRALAMAEYAREEGRHQAFRDAATQGYWTRGMDLENDEHLGLMAKEAGLDPVSALEASVSEHYRVKVLKAREQGIDAMVMGVPTLVVGGMPIVGCQRYETFEKVFARAGVPRRS